MATGAMDAALNEWRSALGAGDVLDGTPAQERFGLDTDAPSRRIPAALRPRSADEVAEVVRVAARHAIPLYPVSTGRNWGYGTANPSAHDSVVVDLSEMKRIVAFDAELGTVTVEPGVTQADLRAYLDENDLPFMVPTTGAGPTCSLLGNAVERGYGITPHADHFGAVLSLRAVLPDGTIYQSALSELGGEEVDGAFKWGIGPYLDGLFSQGSLGIVTQVTLALAREPESTVAFYFWVDEDAKLEEAVRRVREVLRSVGGATGSINLMNRRRVLSMVRMDAGTADTEKGNVEVARASDSPLSDEEVHRLAKKHRVAAWTGLGTIYGRRSVVAAVRRLIRKELRQVAHRILFLTPSSIGRIRRLVGWVPGLGALKALLETVDNSMKLVSGHPSEVALPLCYSHGGRRPDSGTGFDPARDGCGLLWYAPLVPMKPERVREYVRRTEEVCLAHGMEPTITLTSVSDRCFDSTVPIVFDLESPDAVARAHRCYDALLESGRERGFLPYRVGVRHRDSIVRPDLPFFQLATRIKEAVDPNHIIAPGRYALRPDELYTIAHTQTPPDVKPGSEPPPPRTPNQLAQGSAPAASGRPRASLAVRRRMSAPTHHAEEARSYAHHAAQLLGTLAILAFVPTNLGKTAALVAWWAVTFGRLARREVVLFGGACFFFTAMNSGALSTGTFYFTEPDLWGMPLWELSMWGFYLLHFHRAIGGDAPRGRLLLTSVLSVAFAVPFVLGLDDGMLLLASGAVLVAALATFHQPLDLLYVGYAVLVGVAVEIVGTRAGLWSYPQGGIPMWSCTMWGGVGLFLRRLLLPAIATRRNPYRLAASHEHRTMVPRRS